MDIDTWYHLLSVRSLLAAAMLAVLVLCAGIIAGYKAWRAIEHDEDLRTHDGALGAQGAVRIPAPAGEIL